LGWGGFLGGFVFFCFGLRGWLFGFVFRGCLGIFCFGVGGFCGVVCLWWVGEGGWGVGAWVGGCGIWGVVLLWGLIIFFSLLLLLEVCLWLVMGVVFRFVFSGVFSCGCLRVVGEVLFWWVFLVW